MRLDYEEWKEAVIGAANGFVSVGELLEASGLIEPDHFSEDEFEAMMREIEEDIAAAERRGSLFQDERPW